MANTVSQVSAAIREMFHPLALHPSSPDIVRHETQQRGIAAPRWLYITKSYAEWLGVAVVPVQLPRQRSVFLSTLLRGNGGDGYSALPSPGLSSYAEGFLLDGWLYGREPWGGFRVVGVDHQADPLRGKSVTIPITRAA